MVMTCIRQEHPYSLLTGFFNIEQIDTSVTLHPSTMTDTLEPSTMANTEGQEKTTKKISDTYISELFNYITGK